MQGNAYHGIAFTAAVRARQEALGSRELYARAEDRPRSGDRLGPREAAFIAERDSFYMASVSETGWPYVQHRGGPAGFVRVLDEKTLGFADFAGNRQYISLGNLGRDNRVSLFFMAYAHRRRLKVYGRAEVADPADAALMEQLDLPGYRARVERGLIIHVEALDWNCPQHITPRFSEAEIKAAVAPLHARIAELEAALAAQNVPA